MSLNTVEFVSCLIDRGYTHICVVPCSYAKNVINEAINNDKIEYLPAASEAVACSIAAGLKMAGKKTNCNSAIFRAYQYGQLHQ